MEAQTKTKTRPAFGHVYSFGHLTFWVGNAKQAASYYTSRFGFDYLAYHGLETGERNIARHVVRNSQGVTFVFCSPYHPDSSAEMNAHLLKHGDGIKDISFVVEDVKGIYDHAIANGAVSIQPPTETIDQDGTAITATIRAFGDTTHTFVDLKNYKGPFLPGFKPHPLKETLNAVLPAIHFVKVDHIVANQPDTEMEPVAQLYEKALAFHKFWTVDQNILHTEYSALRSIVMTDFDENVTIPVHQPGIGKKKSQIQEFIDYYHGPGAQHVALLTTDIIQTVEAMRARGMEFLTIPNTYYEHIRKNMPTMTVKVSEDIDLLQKNRILLDWNETGYLLQIFTKPVEDRPTLFFQIIQRNNNNGFGLGNFKNLFVSVEMEQEKRGNLSN